MLRDPYPQQRWLGWLLVCVFVGLVTMASGPTTPVAWAYQNDEGDGDGDDGAEPIEEGDDNGDDEGDSDDEGEGGGGGKAPRNFLEWLIDSSGVFGFVLLLLSFVMVALISMNLLQVRRDTLLPAPFIEEFEQKLVGKDYQGAFDLAKSDDSFVARVVAAGLSKLNRGYQEVIEGMQEVGEDENMQMEHKLSYLALIGSVSPMIGLMGTVYGMIKSFQKIATSTTAPKPDELAEGIATALFTTLEGLIVAIPAIVAYGILRNRVARFTLEVGMVSEGLMSRFSTVGRQQGAAGAGGTQRPAEK